MAQTTHSCTKIKVLLASLDVKIFLNFWLPSYVGPLTNPSIHMALNGENRVNLPGIQAARAIPILCGSDIVWEKVRGMYADLATFPELCLMQVIPSLRKSLRAQISLRMSKEDMDLPYLWRGR